MNQNNNYKFSKKERTLFRSIANRIQANPKDYKEAGKWLDEYCSESVYWTRKEEELEKLKEKHDSFPVLVYQQEVDRLEKEIKEKRTLAPIIRFNKAQDYFSDKYRDLELIPKEEAKKIILITWLITDPDAENTKLNITEFENWRWEPLNDVLKFSRGFKGFLFAQNKDSWMKLVNIAWGKIATSKKESTLEPKPPEFFQNLLWILRYGKKWWWLLLLAALVLLLLYILPKLNLEYQNIHPEAKTSGDYSPAISTSGPKSPVTVNYDSAESKAKAEQTIELFSDIPQRDLDKKLIDIRTSKNLRKLMPLETGRSVSQTPAGTYFYVYSYHLKFSDGNVENMLKNSRVDSYKRTKDFFEIHKMSNGQVIFLGYVGDEIGAALSDAAKSNRKEITLFPSPLKDFQNLVMIPISRIFESTPRGISAPETGDISVLDMLIE